VRFAIRANSAQILQYVIDAKLCNAPGSNYVFSAESRENAEMLKTLLGAGATMGADAGASCMQTAILLDKVACVRMLLAAGVCANAKLLDGWTPLELAVHGNNVEMARVLIAHGARVTDTQFCLVTHARSVCNEDMVRLLCEHGAPEA